MRFCQLFQLALTIVEPSDDDTPLED